MCLSNKQYGLIVMITPFKRFEIVYFSSSPLKLMNLICRKKNQTTREKNVKIKSLQNKWSEIFSSILQHCIQL